MRRFRHVLSAMPELAEVEWYRKQWDSGRHHRITRVELHAQNRVFRGTNTRALREHLIGSKLESSARRGKRMLFRFTDNSWLGLHLGMTGKIRVENAYFAPGKHDHLVLYQRERALVFTDPRQFGRVRFHQDPIEPDWWKSDAPEINSRDFDQNFLDEFLQRHLKAPIKGVLLMQNGFPGIGNWMADEILWRAKVLPPKRTGKLTAPERRRIFHATKFVVRRSLQTLGRDFSDPPKDWLIHQKWKRNGICPKHRTSLKHAVIAGRTTAWCANCQER